MKKFEMPKFELIGLSKDLAFVGANDKGADVEFSMPKTTWSILGASKKLSLALSTEEDLRNIGQS